MNGTPLKRVLTVVLLVVLAASLFATMYVGVNPPWSPDPYSEFYLLGVGGNASDFPTRLDPGESGTVTVGIINHEGESANYSFRVVNANATGNDMLATQSRTVADGEAWETNVTFSIDEPGHNRIEFLLYKDGASGEPYRTAWLWTNVTTGESTSAKSLGATSRPTREESISGSVLATPDGPRQTTMGSPWTMVRVTNTA